MTDPASRTPWYRKVKWVHVLTLLIVPFLGFAAIPWVPLCWRTAIFSFLYLWHTGLCITAGYHRLWSHRSYTASPALRFYLAFFGTAAFQGPIKWWAREHRAHHRYTDTDEDPYCIKKGFLHAHMLWMIMDQPPRTRHIDISDLRNDYMVTWQRKYFVPLSVFTGWCVPALVAGLCWGDFLGGFLYGGILRMFVNHQATFTINSVAHYFGDQPFDDRLSARDNAFAFWTLGEAFHNFHHQFPSDYRNGIEWYHLDCTKWAIRVLHFLGLASNLKSFRHNEIEKARVQQLRKSLRSKESQLDWGRRLEELPVIEWRQYQARVARGEMLICIEGAIHDVAGFVDEHPGGKKIIQSFLGKDATAVFNGGVYFHSKVARDMLAVTRTAVLHGGGQVEVLA